MSKLQSRPFPKRAAAFVAVVWLGLCGVLLPATVRVSAERGDWLGSTSGYRPAPGGALRGGEHGRFSFRLDWPEEVTVAARVRRRHPVVPIHLTLLRDQEEVHELVPGGAAETLRVRFEPREVVHLRVEATLPGQKAEPAFLLEELAVERSIGPRRLLIWLLPFAVGLGLLRLLAPRTSGLVAGLGAAHGVALIAAGLAFTLDAPAHLALARDTWRAGAVAVALGFAATLALPAARRLRRADVQTLALASTAALVALGFAALGAGLGSPRLLARLFPDIAMDEAETLARIAWLRRLMFGFAYGLLLVSLLAVGTGAAARAPRWAVGAAVVLLQTLLYTAGLEGLAAARYRPRYAARPPPQQISEHVAFLQHPLFGHVPNPLFRGNGVGPAGFRGPQPESPKPDGEVRIACVGDSIVWGWMVPDDGSYPVRLQRELDADPGPPGRIRVFNAGVPSYDSRHVLRTLEARVLPYAPDVVVVTVGWNDLAQAYGAGWRAFPPNPAPVPGFDPATAQWIRALLPPASRTPRPHPGALEQFRANLVRIVESVRAAGSVALLTNLPTIVSGSDTTDDEWRRARRRLDFQLGHLQLFQDVIDETCARTPGVRCALDVFPTSEHGKGRYFFDHCHPTEAGHAIMARRIASALRAQGLPGGVR